MRLMWRDYDPKTHVWAKIELIDNLVGEDLETTTEAMRRLGIEGNDQLLSFLSDCLTDNYHHVSTAAARALVRMGDQTVLSHFIGALMSPNHNVSQMAVWAILAFDDSPPLICHMQRCLRRRHGDESLVSVDSIEALAELGDERAIPCLIDSLDSENDEVLMAAVKALGRFGIECDENTPFEFLRREWRKRRDNLSGPALQSIYGDWASVGQKGEQPSMMSEEKTVNVRLEDLCEIGESVRTMMHDLDNGKLGYLGIEIRKIHEVVEKWVSDEEVLGSCGHTHRCRVWWGVRPTDVRIRLTSTSTVNDSMALNEELTALVLSLS